MNAKEPLFAVRGACVQVCVCACVVGSKVLRYMVIYSAYVRSCPLCSPVTSKNALGAPPVLLLGYPVVLHLL